MRKGGKFKKDSSGLYHYKDKTIWLVYDAIKFALKKRPKDGPCWFWWNDTPALMTIDDTPETLYARWNNWREAYQRGGYEFLDILRDLT